MLPTSALAEFVSLTARFNRVSPLLLDSLNLMVFVSPAKHRPLLIESPHGERADAFMVPSWGGVVILNQISSLNETSTFTASFSTDPNSPLDPSASLPTPHTPHTPLLRTLSVTELEPVFYTWREQLRLALGLLGPEERRSFLMLTAADFVSDWGTSISNVTCSFINIHENLRKLNIYLLYINIYK